MPRLSPKKDRSLAPQAMRWLSEPGAAIEAKDAGDLVELDVSGVSSRNGERLEANGLL